MNYELGYGKGIQKIEIPDANLMGVLLPENAAAERSEDQEVLRALEEPIESLKLREIIRPGEKIAIVTSALQRRGEAGEHNPRVRNRQPPPSYR